MLKDSKAFSGFSVNDLEKAKKFYTEILGIEVEDNKQMGILHLKISGGNTIMVYPKSNHTPASFTILNFPVENVEKTVDELSLKGVQFEKYDNPNYKTDPRGITMMSPKMAWFKDPAENIMSVIEMK